jgi:hypothetical protein
VSDDKQIALVPENDFTMKDLETIEKFKEGGLLGLHALTDTDVERMMGLYLDGKSYRQIAQVTKKNKNVILFLAHKFKWFELRKEYLEELAATLPGKILESKLQSQEFLLHLTLAFQKKIGKNVDQYLRTDDTKFADNIDNKDLSTLLKIIEMLHKLGNENLGTDKPLVGLNGMGDGVTITKTGENSVEITPKTSLVGSKLKQMANFKREQEKSSQPAKTSHDIVVEQTSTEKKNEKTE